MSDPNSTTDYPTYDVGAGNTGKRDMLRDLEASRDSSVALMDVMFRIAHTDFDLLLDKSTLYSASDTFQSAI